MSTDPASYPGGPEPSGQPTGGSEPYPYPATDPYSGLPYPPSPGPAAHPYAPDPQAAHPYGAGQGPYAAQPYPAYPPYGVQDTPPYHGYPYPPPMAYGPPPPDGTTRSQAVGALVTNIVLTLFCCSPIAVAGIVVSAMAMGRGPDQEASARRLVRWGWGLAIGSAVVGVLLLVGLVVVSARSGTDLN
ncbi:MAG TPA: hypothetical protein VGD67_22905 [Pseudonocardiaceae bacterium]